MKRIVLALLLALGSIPPAFAQGIPNSAQVTSVCGTPPASYTPGQNQPVLQDPNGRQCVNLTPAGGGGVPVTPSASATTVENGSITTGGTFQQIHAANSARLSFEFQNKNAAHTCYLYFGATASATTVNSITVVAGGYYGRTAGQVPSDAIQVTCSNTSDVYWAQEQ